MWQTWMPLLDSVVADTLSALARLIVWCSGRADVTPCDMVGSLTSVRPEAFGGWLTLYLGSLLGVPNRVSRGAVCRCGARPAGDSCGSYVS